VLSLLKRQPPPDPRREGLIWTQKHLAGLLYEAEEAIGRAESNGSPHGTQRLLAQLQVINELLGDVREQLGE